MPREDYTNKMVNGERVDLTEAEIDALVEKETAWANGATDRAWEDLRAERDRRLAVTDWRASSDLTLASEWATYRQQLRDLPEETEDPGNVTWPTPKL